MLGRNKYSKWKIPDDNRSVNSWPATFRRKKINDAQGMEKVRLCIQILSASSKRHLFTVAARCMHLDMRLQPRVRLMRSKDWWAGVLLRLQNRGQQRTTLSHAVRRYRSKVNLQNSSRHTAHAHSQSYKQLKKIPLTKGWSFLQAFRSSASLAIAMPDILCNKNNSSQYRRLVWARMNNSISSCSSQPAATRAFRCATRETRENIFTRYAHAAVDQRRQVVPISIHCSYRRRRRSSASSSKRANCVGVAGGGIVREIIRTCDV